MEILKQENLETYINELLKSKYYSDYRPNGLQIKRSENISKIAFSVSTTKLSIEKAIELNADTLIVHHGLFWKFHPVKTITGPFSKRIKPLIKNEINLFGYHLPLDGHKKIGNAAMIGKLLSLENIESFGDYKKMPTGIKGTFPIEIKVKDLKSKLEKLLDHKVLLSSHNKDQFIKSIGIITGGANSSWNQCIKENLDAYLTGEMSEHDWHEAKESEIHMFAGGHHATEQFGIKALQKNIEENFKEKFKIETVYIDSENPA